MKRDASSSEVSTPASPGPEVGGGDERNPCGGAARMKTVQRAWGRLQKPQLDTYSHYCPDSQMSRQANNAGLLLVSLLRCDYEEAEHAGSECCSVTGILVGILSLSPTSCVTLGKGLHPTVLQLPVCKLGVHQKHLLLRRL